MPPGVPGFRSWRSVRAWFVPLLLLVIFAVVYPFAVAGMPRSGPGESVLVPWWLVVGIHGVAVTLAGVIAAWTPSRPPLARVVWSVIYTVLFGSVTWHLMGSLLDKAWRRGL